jgi:hypothetical protein
MQFVRTACSFYFMQQQIRVLMKFGTFARQTGDPQRDSFIVWLEGYHKDFFRQARVYF